MKLGIGAALLAAVGGLIIRATLRRGRTDGTRPAILNEHPRIRPILTMLIGLVGGVVVGMTSVGSGSIIIVMLMLTYPELRAGDVVGIDLV